MAVSYAEQTSSEKNLAPEQKHKSKIWLELARRLACSTVILLCLFLFGLDCAIKTIKPLQYFDVTEFIPLDQNPLVAKLGDFYSTANANPPILLLGTSLFLFPSARCDEEMNGQKHRYDNWFIRHKVSGSIEPQYLQNSIEKALGQKLTCANLGVQGSMMSDQLLILERALAAGKTPKLCFLELSPRIFMDNSHEDIKGTPVHQVLANYGTDKIELFKADKINKEYFVDAPKYFWHFYKVKADYRTLIANLTASYLNRPMNNWEAQQGIKRTKLITFGNPEMEWDKLYVRPHAKYNDIPQYDGVYNPPNQRVFKTQTEAFLKLLKLAKSHNVALILVDMPLSSKNRALIKPEMTKQYQQLITTTACDFKLPLIPLATTSSFSDDDFEDSAHLNAKGGIKLFSAMLDALKVQPKGIFSSP
jgi:hypothetical protein